MPGEAIAEAYDAFEKGKTGSPMQMASLSTQTIQESMKLLMIVRSHQASPHLTMQPHAAPACPMHARSPCNMHALMHSTVLSCRCSATLPPSWTPWAWTPALCPRSWTQPSMDLRRLILTESEWGGQRGAADSEGQVAWRGRE